MPHLPNEQVIPPSPSPSSTPETTDKKETVNPEQLLVKIADMIERYFKQDEEEKKALRTEMQDAVKSLTQRIEALEKNVKISLIESASDKDDLSGGKKEKIGEGAEEVDVVAKSNANAKADVKKPALTSTPTPSTAPRAKVVSTDTGGDIFRRVIEKGITAEEIVNLIRKGIV